MLRGQSLTNTISVSTPFSAIFFVELFWDYFLLDKTKILQICNFKTYTILICLKEHTLLASLVTKGFRWVEKSSFFTQSFLMRVFRGLQVGPLP